MEAKRLWETFGETIKIDKEEFYRKVSLINDCFQEINCFPWKEEFPGTEKVLSEQYDVLYLKKYQMQLEMFDELLLSTGVECIDRRETRNGYYIEYLNFGDPYIPTIVACSGWKNKLRIAPYGWAQYVK